MFWRRYILFAVSLTILRVPVVMAQTSTDPAQSRKMSETVPEFDRIQTKSQQLNESTIMGRRGKSILPVLLAIPEFRKATEGFRSAVGTKGDLRNPVRNIEKLLKPFDDYFENLKMTVPPVKEADFKEFNGNDLIWETLTIAERIDNNLQISLLLLQDSERSGAISIKTMQFLNEIQIDMTRFKWLADRVNSIRRLSD